MLAPGCRTRRPARGRDARLCACCSARHASSDCGASYSSSAAPLLDYVAPSTKLTINARDTCRHYQGVLGNSSIRAAIAQALHNHVVLAACSSPHGRHLFTIRKRKLKALYPLVDSSNNHNQRRSPGGLLVRFRSSQTRAPQDNANFKNRGTSRPLILRKILGRGLPANRPQRVEGT